MTSELVYVSDAEHDRERELEDLDLERDRRRAMHQGQLLGDDADFCFICRRATDHLGEHTQEQIDAWKAGR
jgi:hypothetical protein